MAYTWTEDLDNNLGKIQVGEYNEIRTVADLVVDNAGLYDHAYESGWNSSEETGFLSGNDTGHESVNNINRSHDSSNCVDDTGL